MLFKEASSSHLPSPRTSINSSFSQLPLPQQSQSQSHSISLSTLTIVTSIPLLQPTRKNNTQAQKRLRREPQTNPTPTSATSTWTYNISSSSPSLILQNFVENIVTSFLLRRSSFHRLIRSSFSIRHTFHSAYLLGHQNSRTPSSLLIRWTLNPRNKSFGVMAILSHKIKSRRSVSKANSALKTVVPHLPLLDLSTTLEKLLPESTEVASHKLVIWRI